MTKIDSIPNILCSTIKLIKEATPSAENDHQSIILAWIRVGDIILFFFIGFLLIP
jgi:hypothetical protein